MAKKTFKVTITPETYTTVVEASKSTGAINKAHRQWRDEVAKNSDNLDITATRVPEGTTAEEVEPVLTDEVIETEE